ncbi:MAG TPA: hypothetical protein VIK22_07995 [Candidatus Anoxymicrobiaceae bacterium]
MNLPSRLLNMMSSGWPFLHARCSERIRASSGVTTIVLVLVALFGEPKPNWAL